MAAAVVRLFQHRAQGALCPLCAACGAQPSVCVLKTAAKEFRSYRVEGYLLGMEI